MIRKSVRAAFRPLLVHGEGSQPRPLCRLPDGRGRDPKKPLRRNPEADRKAASAAGHVNSMRGLVLRVPSNPTRGVCLDDRKLAGNRLATGSQQSTKRTGSRRRRFRLEKRRQPPISGSSRSPSGEYRITTPTRSRDLREVGMGWRFELTQSNIVAYLTSREARSQRVSGTVGPGALVVLRLRPKSDPSVSSVVHADRWVPAFAETTSERFCRGKSLCRSRFHGAEPGSVGAGFLH
jgi:hypothetical protein